MDVTMPQLGETVTEGTITRWLKQVGDRVEAEEALFEVSTDKVDSEVPAPAAGTVTEIRVPEGDTAAVGTVLAVISDAGAAPAASSDAAPAEPATEASAAPAAPAEPAPVVAPNRWTSTKTLSRLARRELDVLNHQDRKLAASGGDR